MNKKYLHNFIHESRRLMYSKLYKNRNIQTLRSHWRLWAYTPYLLPNIHIQHILTEDYRVLWGDAMQFSRRFERNCLIYLQCGRSVGRENAVNDRERERERETWRASQWKAEEHKLFKWRHIPKDGNLRIHHREKTESSTSDTILKSRL
jgi:hypothetical protein